MRKIWELFAEQNLASAAMIVCFGISIGLKVMLCGLYNQLIKETDNLSITNNRQLKQCRTKFTNCYEMNQAIANVSVFVDKFISRLRFGPISYSALDHLSGQFMLLSVVSSGVGICRSIEKGRSLGEILPFYIVSFAELYLYFSLMALCDIRALKELLKINLVDSLENHLIPRILETGKNVEMLREDCGETRKETPKGKREPTGPVPEETEFYDELEDLISEFLTG